MPFLADPFTMFAYVDPGLRHTATPSAAPPAGAMRSVADDTEHVRSEARIDAMDANRTDDDAVPEHDPDGTPWAA